MAKAISLNSVMDKPKVKRPGVHAKCKTSSHKGSKNYRKLYRGQGR